MNKIKINRILAKEEINNAIKTLELQGYCVIEKYLCSENLENLNQRIEEIYQIFYLNNKHKGDEAPLGLQSVIKSDRVINNLFHFDSNILELASGGDHLQIIKHFLNDPFYGLIPNDDINFILAQLNAREGKVSLPFHVDTRLCTPGLSTWSMQGFIPLKALSSENGGLRIRPGTHKTGVFPDSNKNYLDADDLVLGEGDLVLFDSQTHHATYECATNNPLAWTILFTYRCWWVKQQYDLFSMVPPEFMSELTPNQKLIMGGCSNVSADIYSSPSSRRGYEAFK